MPPPETPQQPSSPKHNTQTGGTVLGQEESSGGGGVVETAAPSTESTLPFTGVDIPLLVLAGAAFLGLGLVLRRVSAERG